MAWLYDYWWIILVLLAGMIIGSMRDLARIDVTKYLNKPKDDKNDNQGKDKKNN